MRQIGDLDIRQAGILMPLSSIPSKSGIGDLGESTKRFLDDASQAGFAIWQILPLNPVGYGNSPYQPYSSFAGDEIYISLEELKKDGLLEDVEVYDGPADHVDYEKVRSYKAPYLKKAYENFVKTRNENQEYQDFLKEAFWLDRYALFRVLKEKHDGKSWTEWPEEDRALKEVPAELEEAVNYQRFLQFIFAKQWKEIVDYAHSKGLTVVGDMPIYVGLDSADVWQFTDSFLLDEKACPVVVAGCPPDYFSETGQLWGNPIYDWQYLKDHDYDFWVKRFEWNKKLFDVIRIDHFIGFDRYWAIPHGEETARNGHWEEGPRYDLFNTVFEKLPDLKLIAEDLGVLRPQVHELKQKYNLLGMRIGQYSLGPNEEKVGFVLPEQSIIYTGTHDNDPVNGWYASLTPRERKYANKVFRKLNLKGRTAADKVLYYSLHAHPRIAIIPMQDFLNGDQNDRMNRPGTIGSPNWEWRMNDFALFETLVPKIRKDLKNSNRLA